MGKNTESKGGYLVVVESIDVQEHEIITTTEVAAGGSFFGLTFPEAIKEATAVLSSHHNRFPQEFGEGIRGEYQGTELKWMEWFKTFVSQRTDQIEIVTVYDFTKKTKLV